MKVFCTRVILQAGLTLLDDAGIEVGMWREKRELTPAELIENALSCDALLSSGYNKIDATFLNTCKHLRVISMHSAGYDNVDVSTATQLKIPVGNTPGVVSQATATTAFLLMIASSRKAFFMNKKISSGQWNFFDPTADLGIELRGKTIGIFGLGKIGLEMARLCSSAFGMKVIYHNRKKNPAAEGKLGARLVCFEDLLQNSDVLSVHSVLSKETRGIFNRDAFKNMKPSSIFINTARGGIHREEDLIEALQKGVIWGAGLDVTNPEPMRKDNPLLTMSNVAITPHIGGATVDARNAQSVAAARNVIAALSGKRIPFPVNPEVYD